MEMKFRSRFKELQADFSPTTYVNVGQDMKTVQDKGRFFVVWDCSTTSQ